MHPYWTPFFYIKFGLAFYGGFYFGSESIPMGIGVFIGAIVGVTIIANILYPVLRAIVPELVAKWELAEARAILGSNEPDDVENALDEMDFEEYDNQNK
ncbi:hypothetical protein [Enterovibrio calviensis]|uniref:hypothetical protein n=1 Tax=Enterovibrio calviensis TaxID=91359 RepID=UPI0004896B95|nr:hypothetical protein [Enterovibrio calviensis]